MESDLRELLFVQLVHLNFLDFSNLIEWWRRRDSTLLATRTLDINFTTDLAESLHLSVALRVLPSLGRFLS